MKTPVVILILGALALGCRHEKPKTHAPAPDAGLIVGGMSNALSDIAATNNLAAIGETLPPGFEIDCDQFGHFAPAYGNNVWPRQDHTNKQDAIKQAWWLFDHGYHTNLTRRPQSEWRNCEADAPPQSTGASARELTMLAFKAGASYGADELWKDLELLGMGVLTNYPAEKLIALRDRLADLPARAWSNHPASKINP